jgi:hypothetical protein
MMHAIGRRGRNVVRCEATWAEDRAALGSDPSADPGAKTGGRAAYGELSASEPSATRLSR